MAEFSDQARLIAAKFDAVWDPFTKSLYGKPKTALGIGVAIGAVGALLLTWLL